MPISLSAVILTKNENKNIEKCIKSADFCSEIIVIDDYSTDKTLETVHKINNTYKVYQRKLNANFAGQRNFGLEKAQGEWILFVDADEIITSELKSEILAVLANQDVQSDAFYVRRRDYWWDTELKYGETRKVRNKGIIRLVRRKSGKWMGNVHEIFHTAKKTGTLNSFLNHYPHPTIKEFIRDINLYSTLRSRELFNQGQSSNVIQFVFYPFFKFILVYFVYLGFLDGPAGFAYAFLMSFHSFLVRTKLYQYRLKSEA